MVAKLIGALAENNISSQGTRKGVPWLLLTGIEAAGILLQEEAFSPFVACDAASAQTQHVLALTQATL